MLKLDHVVASSRHIDLAGRGLERLGFTLSPRSFHPFGTMNNLVVFETTFYELLALNDAERLHQAVASGAMLPSFGDLLRSILETREGPCLVALASDDTEADVLKLAERGIEIADTLRFRRPVVTPNGQDTEAVVTVTLLPNPSEPDVSLFISQQHNLKAIWVPGWQQHRNGALDIDSVTYVADSPLVHVPYFTAIFGDPVQQLRDDEFHFDGGPSRIIVTTPPRFQYRFSELDVEHRFSLDLKTVTIRVRDIDVTAACLEENGVAFTRSVAGSLQVKPESAARNLIEFV